MPLANVNDEATNNGWLHLCTCPVCNQNASSCATLEISQGRQECGGCCVACQSQSQNKQDEIRPHSITLSNGCVDYKHILRFGKRTNGSYRCPTLSFEKRCLHWLRSSPSAPGSATAPFVEFPLQTVTHMFS